MRFVFCVEELTVLEISNETMSIKISYRSVARLSKESAGVTPNFPVPRAPYPRDSPSTFWKSAWNVRAGEADVN